jgi:hypothetical protein
VPILQLVVDMLGYILGISLYFVGIGLWVIALAWLVAWGFVFLIPVLPAVAIAFIAGYCTNILGRREEWPQFKSLYAWKYLRRHYFQFTVHGDEEGVKLTVDKKHRDSQIADRKRYIWAVYPHGAYSLTALFHWALNPDFAWTRGAIHSALFYVPFLGSIMGWIGAISVTREEMETTLGCGHSLVMCPGGVADIANTGNDIKHRRGFMSVAQKTGAIVMPVWCPDERGYYRQWLPLGRLTERFLGFPVPLFIYGRWWCPLLPLASEQSRIYVGTPIDCGQGTLEENISAFRAQIAELQRQAEDPKSK